jgi:hypothetical protein
MVHEKEKAMQTLDELKQLEGRDAPTRHEAFREAPGDRPALPAWAGESLDDLEFASLKQASSRVPSMQCLHV